MTPQEFMLQVQRCVHNGWARADNPTLDSIERFSHKSVRVGLRFDLRTGEKFYLSVVRAAPPGGDNPRPPASLEGSAP